MGQAIEHSWDKLDIQYTGNARQRDIDPDWLIALVEGQYGRGCGNRTPKGRIERILTGTFDTNFQQATKHVAAVTIAEERVLHMPEGTLDRVMQRVAMKSDGWVYPVGSIGDAIARECSDDGSFAMHTSLEADRTIQVLGRDVRLELIQRLKNPVERVFERMRKARREQQARLAAIAAQTGLQNVPGGPLTLPPTGGQSGQGGQGGQGGQQTLPGFNPSGPVGGPQQQPTPPSQPPPLSGRVRRKKRGNP